MLVALCLVSTLAAAGDLPPGVLARIGDTVITKDLFDAYWAAMPQGQREAYLKGGGQREFLQDLVDQKLIVAAAEKEGYPARPEVRVLLDTARDRLLYRAWVEDNVTSAVLSDEVLRRYYEEHKERFRTEDMVRVRQIVLTPHKDLRRSNESGEDAVTEKDAAAKADRLLREIRDGADFAALARRYSEDLTAKDGGLIEDFPRGKMAKPVEEAAFALKPGEVSGVIRSPYGFHLLKLEAALPSRIPAFAEVKERVMRMVADERKDSFTARFEQLRDRLRASTRIETNDALLPPAPAATPGEAKK